MRSPGCILRKCVFPALLLSLTALVSAGDLRLITAVKDRDRDVVRGLLKQQIDVNATQGDGTTALHWAGYRDDLDTADILLRAGAKIDAANDLGITPLYLASANGSAGMIKRLLDAGANPNALPPTGVSPLMLASRTGSAEGARALLAHKAWVNAHENAHDQTALMWAVAQGYTDVVRVLLDHGADVNARSRTNQLLMVREVSAARQSCPGANPSAPCVNSDIGLTGGFTPILFAARQGSVASAKLLVAAGANVNDVAPDGNSVLIVAAHAGHAELAEYLLDKDANTNASGPGYTALHTAILRGDLGLVKTLLAHGANPNARLTKGTRVRRTAQDLTLQRTIEGATPLFLAAKYMELPMLRLLLASGADPKLNTNDGTTALMAAAGIGWASLEDRRAVTYSIGTAVPQDEDDVRQAATILLDLGLDVNGSNANGDTALHGAVSKGYDSVVRLFVEKGAKLDARNKRGRTPLSLTAVTREGATNGEKDLKQTAEVLRALGAKE